MSDHRDPAEYTLTEAEPVLCAETVRMVLALVVGLGWASIPTTAGSVTFTVAALVVSMAASYWTRRQVTPIARRDTDE